MSLSFCTLSNEGLSTISIKQLVSYQKTAGSAHLQTIFGSYVVSLECRSYSADRKFLQSMPLASITFVSNMDTSH